MRNNDLSSLKVAILGPFLFDNIILCWPNSYASRVLKTYESMAFQRQVIFIRDDRFTVIAESICTLWIVGRNDLLNNLEVFW